MGRNVAVSTVCTMLESSLKFRGREEVVAGQDQGGRSALHVEIGVSTTPE
jgi:hypothetical protein